MNTSITLNRDAKLKNGGRLAMKMDMPTFIKKYFDWCRKHPDDIWGAEEDEDGNLILNDDSYEILSNNTVRYVGRFPIIIGGMPYKIEFSEENSDIEKIGITSTGIPYIAQWHAGDWEIPLLVFYYFDKNGKFTNYIPTYGNSFNSITKTACNSETEYIIDNYDKLCAKYLKNVDKNIEDYDECIEWMKILIKKSGYDIDWNNIDIREYVYEENRIAYDFDMCLKDFESRVTL